MKFPGEAGNADIIHLSDPVHCAKLINHQTRTPSKTRLLLPVPHVHCHSTTQHPTTKSPLYYNTMAGSVLNPLLFFCRE